MHIIETSRGEIILLDCGMFQGRREKARRVNETFPFDPRRVKAVILSHGHIDHIGNLPTCVRDGMKCPVYTTKATSDLCGIMLRDSAKIQEADAKFVNKHRRPHEKQIEPLYTVTHVEAALKLICGQSYRTWFEVIPGVRAIFHDAGHILGSASILLEEQQNGVKRRLAFTGDLGRPDRVILKDPEPFPSGADILLSECTYGDREHPPHADLAPALSEIIKKTVTRGGKVLIPAFALGRTQALLYMLNSLVEQGYLPHLPVFVDSPLANLATNIVKSHPECFDLEAKNLHRSEGGLFGLNGYVCTTSADESKELNLRKEPCIIISASGMCEAGRILHHLIHGIEDSRNTILIVGFQAQNTLGRKLVEHWPAVRIFGRKRMVRAHIEVFNGFSGHADRNELAAFLNRVRPAGPVYLVHGDERQATAFEHHLESQGFPDVRIPYHGDVWKI